VGVGRDYIETCITLEFKTYPPYTHSVHKKRGVVKKKIVVDKNKKGDPVSRTTF
jgi:hypothetical protein